MKIREAGLATVEFAIAGATVMMVLFGCIEIGRMMFVWNTIGEATRVAARLATVSSPTEVAAIRVKVLSYPGFSGLTADNVTVTYILEGGVPAYVSVGISGYEHTLLIPFVGATVTVPAFQTTLPVESLGYIPG